MKRWPTKPLGETLIISNERIQPKEHSERLFNYVGLESIESHSGNLLPYQQTLGTDIKSTKNVFHRGDILYGKLRPYLNKVHLADVDGVCSTDIYVLRPHQSQIHPLFAASYLRSPSVLSVVSNAMTGANLPRISQDTLLDIPIPVPPLAEQERIVKLLDEADTLRKLRAQADRRTTQLIPALFHKMFSKAEENQRRLGDLSEIVMGQAPPGDECNFDGKGTPFVKTGEFGERRPIIREWTTKPLKFAKSSDVLICVVGATCGKLNLGADCAIGRSVAAIRPNSSLLDKEFLYAFLHGWTLRLRNASQGSAQGVITREMLESIPISVPPLTLQKKFAQQVSVIRACESEQSASRDHLDALFQSMLHRAFNGELK